MNFTIVDIEPNTPEHFEFRKGKIGASHAPTIMGCGFQTAVSLWEEMVFGKERHKTASMARGIDLEPKARDWANKELSIDFRPVVTQDIANPWRIASLDGYAEPHGAVQILEIKCPGKEDHAIAMKGKAPKHYMPQLQHQMDVTGVDHMYYVSFDGEDGCIVVVDKDEKYCKKLLDAEREFYNCIIEHRRPADEWVEITNEERLKLADKRIECYNLIKKLEADLEAFDEELTRGLCSERNLIGNLKIWKETRPGSIDYKKLENEYKINLDAYRKADVSYWKMKAS